MAKKKAKDSAGYGTYFPPQNVDKERITGTKLKAVLQWKLSTFLSVSFWGFYPHIGRIQPSPPDQKKKKFHMYQGNSNRGKKKWDIF